MVSRLDQACVQRAPVEVLGRRGRLRESRVVIRPMRRRQERVRRDGVVPAAHADVDVRGHVHIVREVGLEEIFGF